MTAYRELLVFLALTTPKLVFIIQQVFLVSVKVNIFFCCVDFFSPVLRIIGQVYLVFSFEFSCDGNEMKNY